MQRVTTLQDVTTWRIAMQFTADMARGDTLEYKYVIKQTLSPHALVSWEGLPGNRTLTIAHGTNVALYVQSI